MLLKVVRAFKLYCSLIWETFRCRFSVEFGTKAVAGYADVMSKTTITIVYYSKLQGVWPCKISSLWGCLHWSSLILFGGCWISSVASVYQTMKPCNGQYYHTARSNSAIIALSSIQLKYSTFLIWTATFPPIQLTVFIYLNWWDMLEFALPKLTSWIDSADFPYVSDNKVSSPIYFSEHLQNSSIGMVLSSWSMVQPCGRWDLPSGLE